MSPQLINPSGKSFKKPYLNVNLYVIYEICRYSHINTKSTIINNVKIEKKTEGDCTLSITLNGVLCLV